MIRWKNFKDGNGIMEIGLDSLMNIPLIGLTDNLMRLIAIKCFR
jgi:hypothetical protein